MAKRSPKFSFVQPRAGLATAAGFNALLQATLQKNKGLAQGISNAGQNIQRGAETGARVNLLRRREAMAQRQANAVNQIRTMNAQSERMQQERLLGAAQQKALAIRSERRANDDLITHMESEKLISTSEATQMRNRNAQVKNPEAHGADLSKRHDREVLKFSNRQTRDDWVKEQKVDAKLFVNSTDRYKANHLLNQILKMNPQNEDAVQRAMDNYVNFALGMSKLDGAVRLTPKEKRQQDVPAPSAPDVEVTGNSFEELSASLSRALGGKDKRPRVDASTIAEVPAAAGEGDDVLTPSLEGRSDPNEILNKLRGLRQSGAMTLDAANEKAAESGISLDAMTSKRKAPAPEKKETMPMRITGKEKVKPASLVKQILERK